MNAGQSAYFYVHRCAWLGNCQSPSLHGGYTAAPPSGEDAVWLLIYGNSDNIDGATADNAQAFELLLLFTCDFAVQNFSLFITTVFTAAFF
jgi:hypothetical protein